MGPETLLSNQLPGEAILLLVQGWHFAFPEPKDGV